MFNPHGNTTADGHLIEVGTRVLDYDHRLGTVVKDETSAFMCDGGYCKGDHWFEVESDEGGRKSFNGDRLAYRG